MGWRAARVAVSTALVGVLVAAACSSGGDRVGDDGSDDSLDGTPITTVEGAEATTTVPPPKLVAAVGDIACPPGAEVTPTTCQHAAVAPLVTGADAILLLGDIQYDVGAADAFAASFDKTWGRLRDVMVPAPGNHEYETPGAAGYYGYFGAVAGSPGGGWHSRDVGDWHVVALNSNCAAIGGCGPGSPQEQWLRDDLAASSARCAIAFWHHPRFSSGQHGDDEGVDGLWRAAHEGGVDLVLTGHDHLYERLSPLDAAGDLAEGGMVSMVVGTGGKSHYKATGSPRTAMVLMDTFGVLRLVLFSDRASFEFVDIAGAVRDQGTIPCR